MLGAVYSIYSSYGVFTVGQWVIQSKNLILEPASLNYS